MSAYTNKDAAEFLVREIWPLVSQSRPEMTLDIVGSSAPRVAAEVASRDPRVRVHGFVDNVLDIVRPGTIFLCPVRDGGGTKLKILDAMNRGLPIIAHPIAMEGIDAVPNVHVLLARTASEFAEAVDQLASDERRMSLAKNAYALVRKHYAFDQIASSLLECYERLMKTRSESR
jgi:glycosyltransferase involved in cell wall biosynthesis